MRSRHLLICFLGLGLASCALPMRSPVIGGLYTDVRAGHSISDNTAGTRMGKACASSILGFVATGDASIEAARREGKISKITSVDEEMSTILGLYAKHCTIVRGN